MDFDVPSSSLSEAIRHAALSIIREATVNAIRHGHARTIAVSGELAGRRLTFTVVDDGKGFDPEDCRGSAEGHFGLMGMKERAKSFNGDVAIQSSPGNGTEVTATLAPTLSARQKDILKLVSKGFNNDEIAERIGISRHGVKAHLAIAFDRLGVASRAEAASMAISLGLI